MSKYMDFAPARATKAVSKPAKTSQPSKVVKPTPKSTPKPAAKPAAKPAKSAPALGVVEEITPRNTPSSIPKRPLGTPAHFNTPKSAISSAKAQKVGNQKPTSTPVKSVEKPAKNPKTDDSTYKPPKTPFINLDKVKKRPLSKNIYRKEVKVPKEEPKGPVTIIAKPEKDSHISLIVTVIITIILGAVAGTIAFLLLPK